MMKILMDVHALERLIGGQDEVAVELRKGVVAEFAKRHFRQVLMDDTVKDLLKREGEAIRKVAEEWMAREVGAVQQVGDAWNKRPQLVLKQELQDKIYTHMHKQLEEYTQTLRETFEDRVVKAADKITQELSAKVEGLLAQRVEKLTTEFIDRKVRERLAFVAASMATPING